MKVLAFKKKKIYIKVKESVENVNVGAPTELYMLTRDENMREINVISSH